MSSLFFFNDTATTEIYTLSLHDALPISHRRTGWAAGSDYEVGRRYNQPRRPAEASITTPPRSEEHTSELQSHLNLVCRLLLEKKKTTRIVGPNTSVPSSQAPGVRP